MGNHLHLKDNFKDSNSFRVKVNLSFKDNPHHHKDNFKANHNSFKVNLLHSNSRVSHSNNSRGNLPRLSSFKDSLNNNSKDKVNLCNRADSLSKGGCYTKTRKTYHKKQS